MDFGVPLIVLVIFLFLYKAIKKNRKIKEDAILSRHEKSRRISYPKTKHADGRRKAPHEREKDLEGYLRELSLAGKDAAKAEKIKQSRLGVTHYIWRSAEDGDTCKECQKNNGKKFAWSKAPKTGHPGEGLCCPRSLCRCYPEAVIK